MKNIKNILEIYIDDIKDLRSNFPVLFIVIGLSILPSLYAWFNIAASWDPYGNTKNMSVAITNNDKGTEVSNQRINVGNQLIDKLKKNRDLKWQFVNKNKALEGVKSGKYYASVVIPNDFSKDLTSLLTSDVKKGRIEYTVNEKINAVSPKITEKGASTIQQQVNETVVKTVSQIVLSISKDVGMSIDQEVPKLSNVSNSLKDIKSKFSKIDDTISLASTTNGKLKNLMLDTKGDLPSIKNTISDTKKLSYQLKSFLQDTNNNLNKIIPSIKSDLNLITDISSSVSKLTSSLKDAIDKGGKDSIKVIDFALGKLQNLKVINETLLNFIQKLDNISRYHLLKPVIDRLKSIDSNITEAINILNDIKTQVSNGQKPADSTFDKLNILCQKINNLATDLVSNFDTYFTKPLNDIFADGIKSANDAINILNKTENKIPNIEDLINSGLTLSNNTQNGLNLIKGKLPVAKSTINDIIDAIDKVNNDEDLKDFINLLKSNINAKSDFLKEPVQVDTNRIYPMKNYGTAMSPFYSVLATWVGILLLSALLTIEVKGKYKPSVVYFGRSLTFLSIALVQGLIIALGDIFLLGVQAVHPILFIVLLMFSSMVFNYIVYSLVSVFKNTGKALAIILLVIQIGGSGGTFPIQVTPKFFQIINPILPFTYSISASREAVGGIYWPNLAKDLIAMVIFMILFILLSVFLKGPINRKTARFWEKFDSSRITG